MPVRPNRMKEKLRQGQPVFGGLLRTPEPTMVEVLGYAEYDDVVVDAEHGAHSFEALDTLMLTAYASNVTPTVRVIGSPRSGQSSVGASGGRQTHGRCGPPRHSG